MSAADGADRAISANTDPDARTVIVGTETDYPPYSYLDEKGRPTGFSVEMTEAIAQVMQLSIRIRIAPWSEIRNGLADDSVDVIAGMYYSSERGRTVLFSPPYTVVHHAVFARKDTPHIETEADLRGKRLIVMRGDIMHDYVLEKGISKDILLADTQGDALRLLAAGKHDYALLAKLPGLYWIERLGLTNLTTTGPLLCPSEYCFATSQRQDHLIDAFSEGLGILKKTGKYQEIHNRWLGVYDFRELWGYRVVKFLGIAAAAVLVLFILVIALSAKARLKLEQRVKQRTADLATANDELIREIEERCRAEESLHQAHSQLQAIFDGIIEGLLITNIETQRFVRANAPMCRMLGYTEEELLSASIKDIHPREEVPNDLQRFQAAAECRVTINEDRPILRKDGSIFYADITGHRIIYQGRPCLLALFRDITERKRAQQDLMEAKQAAEAASRTKSEFLANVSHEIRTPMTAILGFADILAETITNQDSLEAIQIIKRNGNSLLHIINDILDLSKIESGKCEIERVACSPCQIAAEVVSTMKMAADGKGISLDLEYSGSIPQCIRTDPTRLRQILVNLIGNAVKFTEAGGVRVIVQLDRPSDQQPKLRFDVIDTGIGMSEEQLNALFRPFSQVDSSAHRRFGGTGLGLVISKRLSQMLGGDIEVASAPGKGSAFSATIATGATEKAQLAAPTVDADQSRLPLPAGPCKINGRILLAEDGSDNQRLIAFLLRKAGAEVMVVENGQMAVYAALTAQQGGMPFDAILMDMQMPVIDGYEAVRRLRIANYRRPIIALTAHAMTEDRRKCLDAGCDDYLSKPIDRNRLLATVANHVDNRTMHPAVAEQPTVEG